VQSAVQWPLVAHRVGRLEGRTLLGSGLLPRLRHQLAHVAEAGARVVCLDPLPVCAREQLPTAAHNVTVCCGIGCISQKSFELLMLSISKDIAVIEN